VDSSLSVVQPILFQLTQLSNQFIKSMTAGSSGTGTLSQILTSITGTLDVIMLGFLGSGVVGFIVLILYTQKVIIGLITYTMVFSMLVVLCLGTWIVNST